MFLGIPRIGARVNWEIGEVTSTQRDKYPGRILDAAGRQVSLFVLRKDKAGNVYPDHVLTTTRFIEPREELIEEVDAPTIGELMEQLVKHNAERQAQLAADAVVS